MACITSEQAHKIIRKLKAKKSATQTRKHIIYDVFHNNQRVVWFGVSHTPKKGFPHDHLPAQLGINQHKVRRLAECSISRDEYITELTQ